MIVGQPNCITRKTVNILALLLKINDAPVNTCFASIIMPKMKLLVLHQSTSKLNVLIFSCSCWMLPALQRPFPGTSWEPLHSESPRVISLPWRCLLESRILGKLLSWGKFSQLLYRPTAVIPSKLWSKDAPQRPWEDGASKASLWPLRAQDYQKWWKIK